MEERLYFRQGAILQGLFDGASTRVGDMAASVSTAFRRLAELLRLRYAVLRARFFRSDAVFPLNRLAARQLLDRTPFVDQARAAGQPCVRLLFAGFSPTVTEVIIQFLRIGQCAGLGPCRIDILCNDVLSAVDEMTGRAPNLRYMLDDPPFAEHPPLAWTGSIHMHADDPGGLPQRPDPGGMLEKGSPVTAIIVAGGSAAENLEAALAIRRWTARQPAFAAPIYVEDGAPDRERQAYRRYDGVRPRPDHGLLATLKGSGNAAEAIEPFGVLEELCAPDFLFGAREHRAALLHAAYRQKRLDVLDTDGGTGRSDLPDWDSLDETYRQANRRAVDFLPVIRLAAGIEHWWDRSGDGLTSAIARDPELMETLARMVHASWRADRELDGWRQGDVRDAGRRLHTDLLDYDALTEDKKELDREQIRLLAELERLPEDQPQ